MPCIIVCQGSRLGFVAETGNFVTINTTIHTGYVCMDALSTIFSRRGLPCFLLFFSFFFAPSFLSRYVYILRVPSSVQQSSSAINTTLSKHSTYLILVLRVFFLFGPLFGCIRIPPHLGILCFYLLRIFS